MSNEAGEDLVGSRMSGHLTGSVCKSCGHRHERADQIGWDAKATVISWVTACPCGCVASGQRYELGYGSIYELPERIQSKVVVAESGCWEWTASQNPSGYGQVKVTGIPRPIVAHRVVYELLVGPIPPGLHLDHLCRVRHCVNPAHLEPVTQAENNRRAGEAKTHCINGHEYTPDNTYYTPHNGEDRGPSRMCRECNRINARRQYNKRNHHDNDGGATDDHNDDGAAAPTITFVDPATTYADCYFTTASSDHGRRDPGGVRSLGKGEYLRGGRELARPGFRLSRWPRNLGRQLGGIWRLGRLRPGMGGEPR